MTLNLTGIMDSTVIADDVVLGYVQFTNSTTLVYPIPGNMPYNQIYRVFMRENGQYEIRAYTLDGNVVSEADQKEISWVKIVIISSSNVTSYNGNSASKSGISKKQLLLDQITEAGVDLNDYYDVCNYFGIKQ